MREQCRGRNQGRFLQNFQIFKVVEFNNSFVTNRFYKYVISFSCSYNTLYEYIRIEKFRYSYMAQFF